MLNLKFHRKKLLGNLVRYKKTTSTDNRQRGKRRNPGSRHGKYFTQNLRTTFPKSKERGAGQGARGMQNTKSRVPENKLPNDT